MAISEPNPVTAINKLQWIWNLNECAQACRVTHAICASGQMWSDFLCQYHPICTFVIIKVLMWPDLECQIGYSAILSVKFSWALGQTENTSIKGKTQLSLGWLCLQLTKKTRTPFPKFLQDRGAGSGSSVVQQLNSSPHEQECVQQVPIQLKLFC